MKRLRSEPVLDNELSLVKNYMTGNFALSLEKPQTIASFAVNTERYGLPKDFYTNYLKNIDAVTTNDVQQMAVKYIQPDRSIILAVGKASEIADKLKRFSPENKIEYFDNEANSYDPSKQFKVAPGDVNPQSVYNKYIEAIGGKIKIEKIKDLTMKASMTVQGTKASILIVYKLPNKYLFDISMNGHTVQKLVYNDGVGKSLGMQGNRDLKGEELERLKIEGELFPELKYQKMGYKLQLKGINQVNGQDTYMIEVTSPSNSLTTEYYSVETGLKIKSLTNEDTPMGKIMQTTNIVDYTESNGIKFPKSMKQSAGPQTFDITVDSIEMNTNVKDDIFK
jgi:hypothetical protein